MVLRNKVYIFAVSSLFLLILLWCPLIYVLETNEVVNFEDLKNYKDPEKVYEDNEFFADFLNNIEKGKASINNIYTNYLPFYSQIITLSQENDRYMQSAFLDFLSNPQNEKSAETGISVIENKDYNSADNTENTDASLKTEIPKEETDEIPPVEIFARLLMDDNFHRYYAFEPYQILDRYVLNPNDVLKRKFENQLIQITKIADADINVNFYVYICTRMQDTEYSKEIVPQEFSTLDYFNEFVTAMENAENIDGTDWLDIDTIEKRAEKVFRTDHHWSGKGAYSAYADVINMMKEETPGIGEPIPLNSENGLITFEGVQMRGSFSATLRFDDYYEDFSVLDITLPEFQTRNMHTDSYEKYSAGNFDKGTFFDHYVNYYNSSNQRRYKVKDNNTGRNLLLIGDSYSWWYLWMIALILTMYIYIFLHGTIRDLTIHNMLLITT